MLKNKEHLALAWDKLTTEHGEQTPKQIKKPLFLIQHHLFQFPDSAIEDDQKIINTSGDLKILYQFIEDVAQCFTTNPN